MDTNTNTNEWLPASVAVPLEFYPCTTGCKDADKYKHKQKHKHKYKHIWVGVHLSGGATRILPLYNLW